MQFLKRVHITPEKLTLVAERGVLALLVFFLLWKGGKTLESTWLLMLLAWVCTYQFWKTKSKDAPQPPLWLWSLLLAYVVWTIASFTQTVAGNYGLDEVLRTAALAFIFLWVGRKVASERSNKDKKSFTENVLTLVAFGAFAACIIGCIVYVLQPAARFVGTFFDFRFHQTYWPNAWAEYLLLSWPVALWWVNHSIAQWKQKRHQLVDIALQVVVMGFLFGCLLLSYSRGAVLVLIAQLGLWAFILIKKGMEPKLLLPYLRRGALMLMVAICVFLSVNSVRDDFYPVQSATEKVTFTAAEGKSSISERQQFWRQSTTFALQRPMFGWGPYTFRFLQPRLQEGVLATSDHSHNVFLKIAMERGIPAAIIFVTTIVGLLFLSYWRWEGKPNVRIQGFDIVPLLLISVSGVFAHNLIDYNLQFVGITLPFWIFLGLLSSLLFKKARNLGRVRLMLGVEVVLMTGLMAVAVFEGGYLILSSVGRHAEARGDSETALAWYSASRGETFSRDLHLSRTILLLDQNKPEDAHEVLDVYFDKNKEDARAWKLRGDACRLQKDWECALANYEEAYQRNKYNDVGILRALVETLRDSGKRDIIDKRRHEFDSLLNDFGLAINQNEHFVALSHNPHELVLLVRIFATLYPEDEPLYAVLGASVARKAEQEQQRLQGSASGYLW